MISYSQIDRDRDVAALRDLGVPERAALALTAACPRLHNVANMTAADIAAAAGARGVPAWARSIAAAFVLVRTANAARDAYRSPLRSPDAVVAYIRGQTKLADAQQEHFGVLLLDARQRIRGVKIVAVGWLDQVEVHPREVFADAITTRAHSIILFHNHPSGDPEPSDADFGLTRRLADVGRTVGIPVVDHIVIAAREAYSFAASGVMPS